MLVYFSFDCGFTKFSYHKRHWTDVNNTNEYHRLRHNSEFRWLRVEVFHVNNWLWKKVFWRKEVRLIMQYIRIDVGLFWSFCMIKVKRSSLSLAEDHMHCTQKLANGTTHKCLVQALHLGLFLVIFRISRAILLRRHFCCDILPNGQTNDENAPNFHLHLNQNSALYLK